MSHVKINTIGYTINVYKEAICQNLKGQLYQKELFVYPINYFYDSRGFWVTEIHFLSPTGWTNGYIIEDYDWVGYNAYNFGYGVHSNTGDFLVRSTTKVINSSGVLVEWLYAGDWVIVSNSGQSHGTWTNYITISGYSSGGVWRDYNGYVNTGINDKSMYSNCYLYSNRW